MSNISEFRLDNKKNNKSVKFRGVAPVNNNKTQPVLDVPLISTSPANTFLFRLFGQSEEFSLNFAIYDDGNAVDYATHTKPVQTVNDQIIYIRDVIFSSEFDASWVLKNARYYPDAGVNCVITNLVFDNEAGGDKIVTGSITIRRGRISLGTGITE